MGSTPPDRRQVQTLFEGVNRLRHKLDGMLSHLGMEHHHLLDRSLCMHKSMPIGATAHQAGTVRFGTDPASSALDVHCRRTMWITCTWWTRASSPASEP